MGSWPLLFWGDIMKTEITLQNVSFRYPGAEDLALDDINLVFRPCERVAILGSNGSGKSTLARLLNGLLMPTTGVVKIGQMQTNDAAQLMLIRSRIGLLLQNPENQVVASIVEEEVAFGPRNLGLDPAEVERRVHWALKLAGLTAVHQELTNQLSGGQLQRLALAGVMAMEPEFFILDEAFSMLDEGAKRQLLGVMQDYRAAKEVGFINITHDLSDLSWCHRAIVLHRGKVVYNGLASGLLQEEINLEAYGLVLPPLHNLIVALRRSGLLVPAGIGTREELVTWIVEMV